MWNTVSTKMETLIYELLKKELHITYSRGSGPTPDACALGVRIRYADDPDKNSRFIHRLLFSSKPAHKIIVLPLSRYQMEQVIHEINIKFLQFFHFLDYIQSFSISSIFETVKSQQTFQRPFNVAFAFGLI